MGSLRLFQVLLVAGGVLALAGFSLVVSSFGSLSSSTTSIPAGSNYIYLEFHLLGAGSLRGDYQETTGGALDLFVLTQAQFESYRAGTDIGSLWSLGGSSGGAIDVTLPGSGKYFLVADHGAEYERVPQIVRLTVRLAGIDPTTFTAGVGLAWTGVVLVFAGMLMRKVVSIRPGISPRKLRSHGPSSPAPSEPPLRPDGP